MRKGGVVFIGKGVSGDVLDRQGQGGFQVLSPGGEIGAGDGKDEIQAEVGKAGFSGQTDLFLNLADTVLAAQQVQFRLAKGLRSDGNAVYSVFSPDFQGFQPDLTGIDLDSKFGGGGGIFSQSSQEPQEMLVGQATGAAAADIEGLDGIETVLAQLPEQGIHHFGYPLAGDGEGVKIAVRAFRPAKGNMDIKGRFFLSHIRII